MIVTLPFPDKRLSPNARLHHMALSRAKKTARWASYALAQPLGKIEASALHVTITICPPDRRHRDEDNMIASLKASNDGVADAIGVDDSKWRVTHVFGEPVKGGSVTIEITGREK
jgi:crossover junction endodeoxyribonuclease RusA